VSHPSDAAIPHLIQAKSARITVKEMRSANRMVRFVR